MGFPLCHQAPNLCFSITRTTLELQRRRKALLSWGECPVAFFALLHFSGQGRVHTQCVVPGLARSMPVAGQGLASVRSMRKGGASAASPPGSGAGPGGVALVAPVSCLLREWVLHHAAIGVGKMCVGLESASLVLHDLTVAKELRMTKGRPSCLLPTCPLAHLIAAH